MTCEGPGCGATIPLISQTTIAKGKRKAWIEITGHQKTKEIDIHIKQGGAIPKDLIKTAGGGHAVCPVCGFTTNKRSVKEQANRGVMGQRLFGVALAIGHRKGKEYADDEDRFRNFRNAGKLKNETPEKALQGMHAKHIVSMNDIVDNIEKKGIYPSKALLEEKIGDAINYYILLEGLIKSNPKYQEINA